MTYVPVTIQGSLLGGEDLFGVLNTTSGRVTILVLSLAGAQDVADAMNAAQPQ